ncbi:MAG TPA: isoprenoid biosynthesis glyoxalase ElbB [Bacteroidales bacterium]|nr:isoprenoid biosynthesis glyoxalase ElbB [Bacteroidales bacterium]
MKFAVVLAGCGVYDGAEIQEAVSTLLAIDKNGGTYQIFAPNVMQHHVIDHLTGAEMKESRNVLVEAARIARGKISQLIDYRVADFDALVFPGGFGVAKNLCSYAIDGVGMKIDKVVEKVVRETHASGKPIGALCISPVLITRILGKVEVTIGDDHSTSIDIQAMGGKHTETKSGEIVIDIKNKIVTSPCYMLDATISEIALGAENTVKALIELAKA